jgi:YidC/Oxa1 family membrane protein insertase
MKAKIAIITGVSVFFLLCAVMIADAVFHHPQQTRALAGRLISLTSQSQPAGQAEPASPTAALEEAKEPAEVLSPQPVFPTLSAVSAKEQTVTLGAVYDEIKRTEDPEKYKFKVELTSKGAAVQRVILSEFEARKESLSAESLSADSSVDVKALSPLTLLAPLSNEKLIYSFANTALKLAPAEAEAFGPKAFPLDKLNWQFIESPTADEVCFEAILNDAQTSAPIVKLVKTYRAQPGSYDLDCRIMLENLSGSPLKALMQMQGAGGIGREEVRQDTRKVVAAYQVSSGIETKLLDLPSIRKKVNKNDTDDFALKPKNTAAEFVWAAVTNKYFAAIIRPVPGDEQEGTWLQFDSVQYYPAPGINKDEHNCSFGMKSEVIMLAAAGQEGALESLSLQVYLGPKDKKIFEKNDTYRLLQYFQTIDFRGCCCPTRMIAPLAFGIIWLMNAMYTLMGPLGNYGVIIMFLVFVVRLALHPITKRSQVSMMKMQKLSPKMQEIQKKYANDKQEMNKQVMALYREMGVSPVSGMLPMFLQMPIWIALWTAVNTSIDLRGAGFLPFWITDLSLPDQLFAIPFAATLQKISLLGFPIGKIVPGYFNLLPILMGVVMYFQQKLMPTSQASAQTNPQLAQQQKMMLIMMPLLFPLMLYSGPSGVNLYIMSSIGAGVIEQKVIRKHLKEKEALEAVGKVPVTAKTGGKVKKKKPKPFFKG